MYKSKVVRRICAFLAFSILYQSFFPAVSWALTSGPTQPEVQGFTPIESSDMVDLFTGDFSYNITLLDIL